jgi:hypothetical protein
VDDARRLAGAEAREIEAEKLYAAAAAFYSAKQLLQLKPLIESLQKRYAATRVATDGTRKPSVADMAKAVAKLGNILTVDQSGKGQHVTIQAAIDAAPPGATIVILDSALYGERLFIPAKKKGLTLRGKDGCWPIISSRADANRRFRRLVDIEAPDVTFERLVLALHRLDERHSSSPACIRVADKPFRIRSSVLYCEGRYSRLIDNSRGRSAIDHCIIAVHGYLGGPVDAANSIWLASYARASGSDAKATFDNCVLPRVRAYLPCDIRRCTVLGAIDLDRGPNSIRDSILHQVQADKPDISLDYCNVFGKPGYRDFAKPGPHCIGENPLFLEMESFDFRLKSTSPCRGKASDGGDMGCRYTRHMSEMLKLAYELRRRGIIKFTPFGQWDRDSLD